MITKITDHIWLGDAGDAANRELIKKAGITAILNVGMSSYAVDDNIKYINVRLIDDFVKQSELIEICMKILLELCEDEVLIHCDAGMSRSPYILAKFLSTYNKMDMEEAYEFIKEKYPQADENSSVRRANE